jgi:hypothetical protein
VKSDPNQPIDGLQQEIERAFAFIEGLGAREGKLDALLVRQAEVQKETEDCFRVTDREFQLAARRFQEVDCRTADTCGLQESDEALDGCIDKVVSEIRENIRRRGPR